MTLTHWFLLFGGLTILAIAIDGVRRMVSKPATLAIDLDETLQNLPKEDYGSELPNGGARVVAGEVAAQAAVVSQTEVAEWLEPAAATELSPEPELSLDAVADVMSEQEQSLDLALPVDEEILLTADAEEIAAEEIAAEDVVELAAEMAAEVEPEAEIEAEQVPEFDLAAPQEVVAEQEEDANPLAAAFDPTRPVHEVVESHKMVQSDMFAEMEEPEQEPVAEIAVAEVAETVEVAETLEAVAAADVEEAAELLEAEAEVAEEWQQYADIEASAEVGEEVAIEEVAMDDILLTDTGLDEEEPEPQSLIAKVTSFAMGRKMIESRRQQAQEQALEAQAQTEESVVSNVDEVLTIIVAAKDAQGFYGHNLKTLAEACGMVHGSMALFHRYEDGLTEGSTQFSMANMTETGAFDLQTMETMHTAGVVFFMALPSANDSMRAFDYMVETAQCLANNLGGELYDESRSVLRAQTVEHYRQRIREFERRRLARRAHGGM